MHEPLKDCPFCGSQARRSSGGAWFGTGCNGSQHCPAYLRGLTHRSQAEADAVWNTRTPQPTQAQAGAVPLTDEQIEKLRRETFSTENPFCPCDSKTMRKAVWATERAHGIGTEKGGSHA